MSLRWRKYARGSEIFFIYILIYRFRHNRFLMKINDFAAIGVISLENFIFDLLICIVAMRPAWNKASKLEIVLFRLFIEV